MNTHGNTDDFSTGQFDKFSVTVHQKLYSAVKGRMSGKRMTEFSEGPSGPNKTMLGLRKIFCEEEPVKPTISIFAGQQAESNFGYHPNHRILSPADQIDLLCQYLPELSLDPESGKKYLTDLPDIKGWEEGIGVFVKREKFSGDYLKMIDFVGDKIAAREAAKSGKFTNCLEKKSEKYLPDRKSLAAINKLAGFYSGDFFFAPAQFGLKYRGKSVDLSGDICEPDEFLFSALECAQIVLLHEYLIKNYLRMYCGGDLYDYSWDVARFSSSPCFGIAGGDQYLDAHMRGVFELWFGASSGSARAVL